MAAGYPGEHTLGALSSSLFAHIPQLISVQLDPLGTAANVAGSLADLRLRVVAAAASANELDECSLELSGLSSPTSAVPLPDRPELDDCVPLPEASLRHVPPAPPGAPLGASPGSPLRVRPSDSAGVSRNDENLSI